MVLSFVDEVMIRMSGLPCRCGPHHRNPVLFSARDAKDALSYPECMIFKS